MILITPIILVCWIHHQVVSGDVRAVCGDIYAKGSLFADLPTICRRN